jgi:hypothetical protein
MPKAIAADNAATILIGNIFPPSGYALSAVSMGKGFSFARIPDQPLYVAQSRGGLLFANRSIDWVKNVVNAGSASIGGWTFAQHHAYDPQLNLVYVGDGTRYTPRAPINSLEPPPKRTR